MPAPTKNDIVSKAESLLQENGIEGENMPDLADAIGGAVAIALAQFMAMAMVAPGIAVPGASSASPGSLL